MAGLGTSHEGSPSGLRSSHGRALLVTADAEGPLAKRAAEALAAARLEVKSTSAEALPGQGVHVLLDDPSLPLALTRLMQRLPGREMLPDAVLVVNDPARGGLLLGGGFRDVVAPADAGHAVQNILAARAPVVHERLKNELEERFLPALVAELRLRASEAERLLRECIELMRASDVLARYRTRFEKLARRQGIAEAHVQSGLIEAFAAQLAEMRRPRLKTLRRFPVSRLAKTTLTSGEPRLKKRDKTIVADTIAWLDNADLILSLGAEARAKLDTIGRDTGRNPLAALRACLQLIEGERAERLAHVERLHQGIEPAAAVDSWLSEQHGFTVMPPGYALPEHVARLIRNHIHPPPEVYTTWCLDLSSLRLAMTSEVLGAIARELAPTSISARRANTQPAFNGADKEH